MGVVPENPAGPKTVGDLTDLTPEYLKRNYLFGLDFVDREGAECPPEFYEGHIATAVATLERHCELDVARKVVTDEVHDYHVKDYQQYAFLQLFRWPVVQRTVPSRVAAGDNAIYPVQRLAAVYPTGQTICEFPLEWIRLDAAHGQLQLVPTNGSLSSFLIGRGGQYLPLVFQNLDYLPQLWHIDYVSGFEDRQVPRDILDAICKIAAIDVLTIIGDTIFPPGVSSISAGVDGLSQGLGIVNNGQGPAVFQGRCKAYNLELYGDPSLKNRPGRLDSIRDFYKGIRMVVA